MFPRNFIYTLAEPSTYEIRYVGQSSWGWTRIAAHWRPSILKAKRFYVDRWVASLGEDKPMVMILQVCDSPEELDDAEKSWISTLKLGGFHLTNLTDGGDGTRGWKPSSETRALWSKQRKGRKFDEKTHEIWSKQRMGNIPGNSKRVSVNGKEFPSIRHAARFLGIAHWTLGRILKSGEVNQYDAKFVSSLE